MVNFLRHGNDNFQQPWHFNMNDSCTATIIDSGVRHCFLLHRVFRFSLLTRTEAVAIWKVAKSEILQVSQVVSFLNVRYLIQKNNTGISPSSDNHYVFRFSLSTRMEAVAIWKVAKSKMHIQKYSTSTQK
eukprot:scaffold5064_cov121-Cylindrotheca_fusiformis.AAC.5